MTRILTRTVVICAIVALILYNIVMLVEPTPGDAISDIIHGWAERWATAPWAVGVLAGHWFWFRPALLPKPWRYLAILGVSAVVVAVDFATGALIPPLASVACGIVTGATLWSMEDPEVADA
jgi:uncharacterized membrane protein